MSETEAADHPGESCCTHLWPQVIPFTHTCLSTHLSQCCSPVRSLHLDFQVTFVFLYLPPTGNTCSLHLFPLSAPVDIICFLTPAPPDNTCPLETCPKDAHDLSYLRVSSYRPLQVISPKSVLSARILPLSHFISLPTCTCTIPPVP